MAWNWQSTCSACAFVSAQLGAHTACPYHAGSWFSAAPAVEELEQPTAIEHPTSERPWPFTPREFARLLILKSRVRGQPYGW